MSTVIQRIEDLPKVSQLTTGALFYCSQSGNSFNTNPLDIINCISGMNIFNTSNSTNSSGQNLYNLITGFSGELKTSVNWTNKNLNDNSKLLSTDWDGRILYDITGNPSISWNSRILNNSWIVSSAIKSNQDGNGSVDTNPRFLRDSTGNVSVSWSARSLIGNWNTNGTGIATSSQINNLQTQINNISGGGGTALGGVTGVNGITGGINLTSQGNITITRNGQTLNISGSNSVVPSINFSTNIDWSQANTFYRSFNGALTFTFSNTADGQSITVMTSCSSSGNIIWPTNVKWPNNNNTPLPTSGATDVYTFIQINTGIYATVIQNFPS